MGKRKGSITPKRAAYAEAGEPYGRNRKGLKRWLRALWGGSLNAPQSFFLWTDAGRHFFYFVCEGCGSQGRLGIPEGMLTPFGCPDGCGAAYVYWKSPVDGSDLMCVVRPVFVEEGELPEFDDDDFVDDDYEDDGPDFDECGMTADGGCSLAGTEYCDWECPFN